MSDQMNPPPDNPPDSTTSQSTDKNEKSNLPALAALSASASSLASVASSKASVKSGIRPPSKIGRLCGDKHKPPVPLVPTSPSINEIDDPLKKMIDEYGRHRLTDVLEEDVEEDQSGRISWNGSVNRKRYSSSSPASSMDALWELHSRRLSEAGLSRHSDSSTVLTEDTDSFIIGQRVWVGGNKPGHIAFIGETQFAPGEWAGIALDEPIGKNDGSVSGIRYFMCEPKKGVFSRLTRLTRVPLDHGGSGDTFTFTTPPPHNGSHKKLSMSPSPTDSHRSMVKSPVSVFGSNTSLSSVQVDYRIGDRVIIKSGQGSKVGTVRFMGVTEFAPGEWVGVELDEPRGKNDGSVNGIRYFECQPNFGLFAPVSKVSKSPSKVKPNQCQVHSPTGGLPPSGLRRVNSKESMTSNMSMMSSASTAARRKLQTKPSTVTPVPTRTALQEVLKEKQQHIEQLLKERDLERAEITRAASQADEAEQKLSVLTQELTKYRAECEAQLQEHMVLLNELKESRTELLTQLEDEKKKNEDWQFKFEEAEITRADIQIANESHLLKIKDLEGLLASEKAKAENFESDANRLFETVEELIKTKEENERLKKESQEFKNKHVALESNTETTAVLIKSLQDDLDQTKKDCDEKSEMINVLKKEISGVQESLGKQIELAETKIASAAENVALKDKEIEFLKIELDNVNVLASEKNKTIEQLQGDNLSIEVAYQKEKEKLKMELSAKIADLEAANDNLASANANSDDLRKQFETITNGLETNNLKVQQHHKDLEDMQSKHKAELEIVLLELQTQIKQKEALVEEFAKKKEYLVQLELSSAKTVTELNEEMENLKAASTKSNELHKKTIDELNQEILKLKSDNEALQEQLNKERNEIISFNEKIAELLEDKRSTEHFYQEEIARINSLNESLNIDLNKNMLEMDKLKESSSSLEARLEIKSNEYETLILEHEKFKTKQQQELKDKCEELQKAKEAQANSDNVVHNLQTQLQTTKLDLEAALKDLSQYQTNLSDVEGKLKMERDELHNSLKLKISEFDNLRKEMTDAVAARDKSLAESAGELKEKLESIENLNNVLTRQKEESEKIINELVQQHKKTSEENLLNISRTDTVIANKEEEISQLKSKISELDSTIVNKNAELDKFKSEMQQELDKGKADAESLSNFSIQQKVESEKIISELAQKLKKASEDNDSNISQIQMVNAAKEKEITELNIKISELESTVVNKNAEFEQLKSEMQQILEKSKADAETIENLNAQNIRNSNAEIENNNLLTVETNLRQELSNVQSVLKNTIEQLNVETDKTENIILQKNFIILELEAKINELNEVKSELTLQINNLEEKRIIESSLEQQLNEAKSELNSKVAELEAARNCLRDMVQNLEGKLELANIALAEKTKQIGEKDDAIIQLNENQKKLINDIMEDHKSKLDENHKKAENDVITKSEEISKLSEKIEQINILLTAKDAQVTNLTQELTKAISNNEQNISQSNMKVEQLEMENQSCKNNLKILEQELAKLKSEKELLDSEVRQTTSDSSTRVVELEKGVLEKDELILSLKLEAEKAIANSELVIKEQTEKTEAAKYSESELKNTIDQMKLREETNATSLQVELGKKDIVIAGKDKEITALKAQLSKTVQATTTTNGGTSENAAKLNGNPDYEQLLEEKLFTDTQIQFLNSIIVDMQKKNEEQLTKIDLLEKGFSPAAAEELRQLGFKMSDRQVAPRMYCDICEEFDLHETEDCPTQASDEPLSNIQLGKEKKEKPPPRPYCTICEEFDHDTADCANDEEF